MINTNFCNKKGECPEGVAWFDMPYADDSAHQLVECSNAGICNRNTGKCECFDGYIGSACQRSNFNAHFTYFYLIYFFYLLQKFVTQKSYFKKSKSNLNNNYNYIKSSIY
jgi:hypothetical protein